MFMFNSNHSLLYIPKPCKIKKKVRGLVFESFTKMASRSAVLGSLTSMIKGDHSYRSDVKVGDRLSCTIQPDNKHSDNATVVKLGKYDIVDKEHEKFDLI